MDGTLTATEAVGDACWAAAVEATFGIERPDTDWTHYRDVTDLGVTLEVCRRRLRRDPTPAELAVFRRRYVACLRRAGARARPRSVPGANEALRRLPEAGWHVAIATGAWRACFQAKALAAGLRVPATAAVATCDDDVRRAGIVRAAIARAARAAGVRRFRRVVLLGDGVWDARAARRLGLGFVAVAPEGASRLRREGATSVVRDLRDVEGLRALLERARPPRSAARQRGSGSSAARRARGRPTTRP